MQSSSKIVLGTAIQNQTVRILAVERLKPSYFYRQKQRAVFQTLQELSLQNVDIDSFIILEETQARFPGAQVTALDVAEYVSYAVGLGAIETHIDRVQKGYVKRELQRIGRQIEASAERGALQDIEKQVASAEDQLYQLAKFKEEIVIQDGKTFARNLLSKVAEKKASPTPIIGLSTGFSYLDKYTLGLQKGNVFNIAAYTNTGKSLFVLQILLYNALKKIPVFYFSTELSLQQIGTRALAQISHVSETAIRTGCYSSEEEYQKVLHAGETLKNSPFYVCATEGQLNTYSVCSIAKRYHKEYGIQLFAFDYLETGEMASDQQTKKEKKHETVGRWFRELRNKIASNLDIPLIIVTQLTNELRVIPGQPSPKVALHNQGVSHDISKAAAASIFLQRKQGFESNEMTGNMWLRIVKNNGEVCPVEINLDFRGNYVSFVEAPSQGVM